QVLDLGTDRVTGRQAQHRTDALAAQRVTDRRFEGPELWRQRKLGEIRLDEGSELASPLLHLGSKARQLRSRPRASRAAVPPRPPWPARPAPAGSRSPDRGPASLPASCVPPPAWPT